MVEDAREKEYDAVVKDMARWALRRPYGSFNTREDYLQIGREARVRYAEKLKEMELEHATAYLGLAIKSAILLDRRFGYNGSGGGKVARRISLFQFPEKKTKSGETLNLLDVLSDKKSDDAPAQAELNEERRKLLAYVDTRRTIGSSKAKEIMRDFVYGETIVGASKKRGVNYKAANSIYQRLVKGARAYFGANNESKL